MSSTLRKRDLARPLSEGEFSKSLEMGLGEGIVKEIYSSTTSNKS